MQGSRHLLVIHKIWRQQHAELCAARIARRQSAQPQHLADLYASRQAATLLLRLTPKQMLKLRIDWELLTGKERRGSAGITIALHFSGACFTTADTRPQALNQGA